MGAERMALSHILENDNLIMATDSPLTWSLASDCTEVIKLVSIWSEPRENPRRAARIGVQMQPSIRVRNLLETAVLHLQHSPDLNEQEVLWIQEFAAHLITEFSVLKETDVLYAPSQDESVYVASDANRLK